MRCDLIGVSALHGEPLSSACPAEPYEVRVRVAARAASLEAAAQQIGNEVEALYTNGPAGGGGADEVGARGRCRSRRRSCRASLVTCTCASRGG